MSKTLFTGGLMADSRAKLLREVDVLVSGGKIAAIGESLPTDDTTTVIHLAGKVLSPGFIDMHVHLREPGFEHKETIASGARAAVAGGFTTVACMPNTSPVLDEPALLQLVSQRAAEAALAKVHPIAAITKGSLGRELCDIESLKQAGAVAISDDGKGVQNSALMRQALALSAAHSIPVITHAEDEALAHGGSINEGAVSRKLGVQGIPGVAEYGMVARDIYLAELTGGHLHIAHISTAEAVRLTREAKARGVKITAEVAPHHLALTEDVVLDLGGQGKVNPPLRTEADRQALIAGLLDGTIDAIATDHAPHAQHEKEGSLAQAAFGFTGLETAFGLCYKELVASGRASLLELLAWLTWRPAELLGLAQGHIGIGAPADLVVLDLDQKWAVKAEELYSKGKNTPLLGHELVGRVCLTMVDGRIVHRLES